MRIKDILQDKGTGVVVIEVGRTVHDAMRRLNEHSIGALIVTGEGEEIVGIITERDILQECGEHCVRLNKPPAPGEAACPALVHDVMTKDLVIGVLDDDIDYAMGIMTKNRIRHLPILDHKTLVGIISIGDVVSASLKEKVFENRALRDYIRG